MWEGVTLRRKYILFDSLFVEQGFEVFGSFRWRSVPCSCLKSKQPNKEILSDPCFYFFLELFWPCGIVSPDASAKTRRVHDGYSLPET